MRHQHTDGKGGKLRTLPAAIIHRLNLPAEHIPSIRTTWADPVRVVAQLRSLDLPRQEAAYLAYALPEREAVWWGCMCVRHVATGAMPAEQRHALAVSEGWVRRPDAGGQQQALSAAKAAGFDPAAAFVARGAFRARIDTPLNTRTGRMIDNAVRRAATSDRPETAMARLRRFVASGHEIAAGGAGWLQPEACG